MNESIEFNVASEFNEDIFASSIASFSHSDVKGDIDLERRQMLPSLIIRSIIVALCIGLFGYATYMIISNITETDATNKLYDDIRVENFKSVVQYSPSLLEPAPMYTFQEMLNSNGEYLNYIGGLNSMDDVARRNACYRNFLNQRANYPNTYAWIYVTYTQIDYPVMKTDNNEYYLTKNFRGEDSSAGSIFAQCDLSDVYSENTNNVIYGHCMKNGLMFRTLKTFMESANRNTLAKSMVIEIYTTEGLYIYDILSGYRNDSAYFTKNYFANSEQYLNFLDTIKDNNILSVRPKYDENSKICTLVTCTNSSNENERYVLHGILTNFVPASQL